MPRPTSRVLSLLELLQSGGTRTVTELADRLGVDERTVRRYVDHLKDLDVPVESVRGRYGGYRLAPGYRLPPLMLGDDEALAVLLGLVAARRTGLTTASTTAIETAIAKIRRVLPRRLASRLDAVLDVVAFTTPPAATAAPDGGVLLTVAGAVHHRRPLSLRYRSGEGRPSERTLHPHGLVTHSGRWYVTGVDVGLDQERTFRLDRITDARTLPGSFAGPAPGFDAAGRVLSGMARAPYAHEVSLRLDGTREQIRRHLPAGVAILEELGGADQLDGGHRFRVTVHAERLDWIPPVLAALDRPFVIERPDELRGLVHDLAARLARSATADPGEETRAEPEGPADSGPSSMPGP